MRDWDIQFLFHFIRRSGMYIGSFHADDYSRIDSFLIAYELGSMRECNFRNILIKQIESKYDLEFPREGMRKLLQIASDKTEQEIKEFFVKESMEILIEASDANNKFRFLNLMRNQMIERLSKFPEKINIYWVSSFSRELKELKAWKGVNLTELEMGFCEKLIGEINQLIKPNPMDSHSVPSHISDTKNELLRQFNKYAN